MTKVDMDRLTLETRISDCSEVLDVKPGVLLLFFELLTQSQTNTTFDLVYRLGIPKTHLGRVLKFFEEFLQPKTPNVRLKTEYTELVNEFLGDEKNLNESEYREKVMEIFTEIKKFRPEAKRNYDQFLATPETVIKRVLYLNNNHEIYKRDVLFLGDDDLTSVAMAILGKAKRITVVDIDKQLLSFIQRIAAKNNLLIETIEADVRSDELKTLKSKFDLVFTDPPYTTAGVSLFVDSAISSLKLRNSSRIYFCYGNSARASEKFLEVQKNILAKELVFVSIENNFNQYTGATSIGNGSTLYSCSITPLTKPQRIKSAGRIYTHE